VDDCLEVTMAKKAETPLPNELPREILLRLDPKLGVLYSRLPPELASRISVLLQAAPHQTIHPNLVLKFAYLYAAAERLTENDRLTREDQRRSRLELAGHIFGMDSGYEDDAEAKRRYRRGRTASQRIKDSLSSVVEPWRVFKKVVRRYRSDLPPHVQARYAESVLLEVGKVFQSMGIAAVVDKDNLTIENRRGRPRTAIAQAYIWWCLMLPRYRGKWNHMHRLARAWGMSHSDLLKDFQTVVSRICEGANCTHAFGSAWESVLSEKI
jgi:hypothetical protein